MLRSRRRTELWSWTYCRIRLDRHHRCDESVAHSGNRLDVCRLFDNIAQGGTELLNRNFDSEVKVDVGPFRPQCLPKVISADYLPRASQQPAENRRRLRLQLDSVAVTRQPA